MGTRHAKLGDQLPRGVPSDDERDQMPSSSDLYHDPLVHSHISGIDMVHPSYINHTLDHFVMIVITTTYI